MRGVTAVAPASASLTAGSESETKKSSSSSMSSSSMMGTLTTCERVPAGKVSTPSVAV